MSLFLEEVKFSKQELSANIFVFNIKYNYLEFQNNNLFYQFNNQLNYILTHYYAESETTKGNVNRFLSNLLLVLLTKKLFYQIADKWIEKLLKIPWGILNDK